MQKFQNLPYLTMIKNPSKNSWIQAIQFPPVFIAIKAVFLSLWVLRWALFPPTSGKSKFSECFFGNCCFEKFHSVSFVWIRIKLRHIIELAEILLCNYLQNTLAISVYLYPKGPMIANSLHDERKEVKEVMFSSALVCLFVFKITRKAMGGFCWNFLRSCIL